jgi:hypothetical protein
MKLGAVAASTARRCAASTLKRGRAGEIRSYLAVKIGRDATLFGDLCDVRRPPGGVSRRQ